MNEQVQEFTSKNGIEKIIAFSGGADEEKEAVERIIQDSMIYFKDCPVAILTGGTSWGIPKFATEVAKDYGLKTIGVMPARGEKYALNSLDLKLVVAPEYGQSEYGDESGVFAKLSDGVEIIGGSAGTAIEFYHVMKINSRIKDYQDKGTSEEAFKVVAPIAGVGGFSDTIYSLEIARAIPEAVPRDRLHFGGDAAKYILNKLGLYQEG
ncbi:hypothetical protein GOV06_00035 [Candidatus Woesearchaeota archaeon]|nr:hypothetical protein [Candidatus Woesearchaeota archaeon]